MIKYRFIHPSFFYKTDFAWLAFPRISLSNSQVSFISPKAILRILSILHTLATLTLMQYSIRKKKIMIPFPWTHTCSNEMNKGVSEVTAHTTISYSSTNAELIVKPHSSDNCTDVASPQPIPQQLFQEQRSVALYMRAHFYRQTVIRLKF